uniref:Uncharacterized protein n=1 Tax=Romanomermis culicivorax TaxID=13658 RepID=A0A915JZ92_ROMCU
MGGWESAWFYCMDFVTGHMFKDIIIYGKLKLKTQLGQNTDHSDEYNGDALGYDLRKPAVDFCTKFQMCDKAENGHSTNDVTALTVYFSKKRMFLRQDSF